MNVGSIDSLRARAAADPKAAIREAARQFEALFMQELLKSMRQAQQSMASGMFDNAGTQMSTEMLDTQFASKMTGLPGGLAEAIARQLERQVSGAVEPRVAPEARSPGATRGDASRVQAGFIAEHADAARAAEAATGIPAAFTLAQAAHESAWGRREIRHADGTPSHNLFGIKAGASWKGRVAEVTTTEYVDGAPRRTVARFRAYDSHAESFADYARLMKESPRYRPVLAGAASAEGFAQGLQRAGYATDPAYAEKLTRVINTTLRLARGMA
ncbi:MAG TPA: flagellar assembly peptidoglycan hydrolase FlgJ [Albitalea sp.]